MAAVVRVTDSASRAEIEQAVSALRAKQVRAELETTRAEVQVEIDSLLERWLQA
jgi:hypothetical protein